MDEEELTHELFPEGICEAEEQRRTNNLIELVIEGANAIACDVNSMGPIEQIEWLLNHGFTEYEILRCKEKADVPEP